MVHSITTPKGGFEFKMYFRRISTNHFVRQVNNSVISSPALKAKTFFITSGTMSVISVRWDYAVFYLVVAY